MKKLIPTALILALTSFQVVTMAQPAHVHEHPAAQESTSAEMKAMREEMQKKMASAKTDAERQQIMTEQRKNMQGKHGQMNGQMSEQMHGQMHAQAGGHDHGAKKGMPSGDPEMQKRMQSMREQMGK